MAIKRTRKLKKKNGPRILLFLAYTLILFFGTTILVNINPNANESYRIDREERNNKSMKWIFLANNGKEYKLFDTNSQKLEHGSAINYDYLLPPTLEEINEMIEKEKKEKKAVKNEEVEKELTEGLLESLEIPEGEKVFTSINKQEENEILNPDEEEQHGVAEEVIQEIQTGNIEVKEPKQAYQELRDSLEDRSAFLNMVFEYLLAGKIQQLPEGAVRYVVTLYGIDDAVQEKVFEERGCMTPWGYEIEHGQSVLAYQQRSDDKNICNIERRVCKNGKLSGSYTQESCDEETRIKKGGTDYSNSSSSTYGTVKKLSYSTYNSQELDEFIQPPEHAKNEDADFDVHGHINTTTTPKISKGEKEDPISQEKERSAQVKDLGKVCKTPWGESVQPGQFVKAYRFQNGFYDIPCQVQLRLCVDGDLEGLYQYPSCQYWETSYEDFLYGYMDGEQPSPQRLLKMLQTDFQPDPEYGGNLSSVIIDKMLDILRSD